MGIFDRIKGAIFRSAAASSPAEARPSVESGAETGQGGAMQAQGAAAGAAAVATPVDVGAILDRAVATKGQKLDWRHSIVDLMKALDLDSSLAARKELAKELNYAGDMSDSAAMNIWLHKALMKKLEENGGKVPADLMA